jgi:hypothetical protein
VRIAITQPYFFPYLGYFDLLHNVDLFVIYDTVQYIRRGWIHRNRILRQHGSGWQYIIVPTRQAPQKTPIRDVQINNSLPWQEHILNQLEHYKKSAPHADLTIKFVKDCLSGQETSLSRLNVNILARCSELLNLNSQYQFCSDLDIELDMGHTAEERIMDLCEFLGATEYMNLPGGIDLYHAEAFESRNIKLTFRQLPSFTYSTRPYAFEPNLSIIDVLMWNQPEDIRIFLDKHRDRG